MLINGLCTIFWMLEKHVHLLKFKVNCLYGTAYSWKIFYNQLIAYKSICIYVLINVMMNCVKIL